MVCCSLKRVLQIHILEGLPSKRYQIHQQRAPDLCGSTFQLITGYTPILDSRSQSVPGCCCHYRCRYCHHTFLCHKYHIKHTSKQCNLDRLKSGSKMDTNRCNDLKVCPPERKPSPINLKIERGQLRVGGWGKKRLDFYVE